MTVLIVTPDAVSVNEYDTTDTSFVLSSYDSTLLDLTVYNFKLYSVDVTLPNSWSSYIIHNISADSTSFNIKTVFADVFNRVIGYVTNLQPAHVTRFSDLPTTYDALYKYQADPNPSITIALNLNCYFGESGIDSTTKPNTIIPVVYTVNQTPAAQIALFQAAIAKGTFTAKAIAAGKYL